MYKPGMGELPILLYQLDQMILEHAPDLHNHFKAHEFSTATFASKWFLTLFCSVFPKVQKPQNSEALLNPEKIVFSKWFDFRIVSFKIIDFRIFGSYVKLCVNWFN